MKSRILAIFISMLSAGMLQFFTSSGQASGFIHLKGKQFIDEYGDPFYPMVCNYTLDIFWNHAPGTSPTSLVLSSHPKYRGTANFDCQDAPSCDSIILEELREIRDMGFNAVRFGMGWQYADIDSVNGMCRSGIKVIAHGYNDWNREYELYFDSLNIYNPDLNSFEWRTLLGFCTQIMDLTQLVQDSTGKPLKVIFLFDVRKQFVLKCATELAKRFNAVIAAHLKNYSNILALDIYNEPDLDYKWPYTGPPEKIYGCNVIADLYDATKAANSNHLITLGGGGPDDLFRFDMNTLKLDFYSLHVYSHTRENGYTTFQEGWDKIMGKFYYTSQHCSKPFIVGETGMKSRAGYSIADGYDCSISETADFMENCLNAMINCGYTGFSVWNFQDAHSLEADPELFHGLLEGYPPPYSTRRKPAVSKIQQFNPNAIPSPCMKPANYYNPRNFADPNPLRGYVKYADSSDVMNAYVFGWGYYFDQDFSLIESASYTFYNENSGRFELYKKQNLSPATRNPYFNNIRISAPGASVDWFGRWSGDVADSTIAIENDSIYWLFDQNSFSYHENYTETLEVSQTDIHDAWSRIDLSNTIIKGNGTAGGSLELRARDEINVLTDFHAQRGSDVHIHCNETWFDCGGLMPSHTRQARPGYNSSLLLESEGKEIELEFRLKYTSNFEIIPNPGTGNFQLLLSEDFEIPASYSVHDSFGRILKRGLINSMTSSLDLNDFLPGMYQISIKTMQNYYSKKLIKL
ncbi:MAG: T9SS C-terminal target domain-containing protein [Bacteroidetes bacterium]|nr:MAG: T9SS C-terminal target domain-containing protein [Bacteroidota bacterium]REK00406.1 MAG: T9SS C-terminal target domain-containing protein [Bacteroidota bacterium]REK35525.1 MAG: T9SS C-terminal target domain-containing protein [Bacteroidota bacterium]REK49065.1 MAG: T9SS C-terminal target domain-containing protein [Bacteroidota bacterium]